MDYHRLDSVKWIDMATIYPNNWCIWLNLTFFLIFIYPRVIDWWDCESNRKKYFLLSFEGYAVFSVYLWSGTSKILEKEVSWYKMHNIFEKTDTFLP